VDTGRTSPSKSPNKSSSKSSSPTKSSNRPSPSPSRRPSDQQQAASAAATPKTRIDPKLGTQRKTAGVRNLPKIDNNKRGRERRSRSKDGAKVNGSSAGQHNGGEEDEEGAHAQENGTGSSAGSSRRSEPSTIDELQPVEEEEKD
jgi:hypothetical protein